MPKRPTTKPVERMTVDGTKYGLYKGPQGFGYELWIMGRYADRVGYVANRENMALAIDNHREEMRCLMAQAREEFGLVGPFGRYK